MVIIWVDDLVIAASNSEILNRFKDTMKTQLNMKDLEKKISYFLAIQFEQRESEIVMNQKRYIEKMLKHYAECQGANLDTHQVS